MFVKKKLITDGFLIFSIYLFLILISPYFSQSKIHYISIHHVSILYYFPNVKHTGHVLITKLMLSITQCDVKVVNKSTEIAKPSMCLTSNNDRKNVNVGDLNKIVKYA